MAYRLMIIFLFLLVWYSNSIPSDCRIITCPLQVDENFNSDPIANSSRILKFNKNNYSCIYLLLLTGAHNK